MKKIIYMLLAAIFAISNLPAQLVLESAANRFRPGDQLTKQEVCFKDPGRSGKNVLWDFSKLEPVNKKKYILTKPIEEIGIGNDIASYVKEVDDSRTPVSYQTDEATGMITCNENRSIYRYNASGDSLLIWGYEIPTTKISNTLPELWLTFPFRFNDKLFSYYKGEGVYGDMLDVDVMGSIEVEADAYGMMITPDKDTLVNVLRVRTLKTTLDNRQPLFQKKNGKDAKVKGDSIEYALKKNKNSLKTEIIRWYAEGYRYPVFETWKSYSDNNGKKSNENLQAFFYDPITQEDEYLQTDPLNQQLAENNKKKKDKDKPRLKSGEGTGIDPLESLVENYNIYPNPTPGDLHAEIYLKKETTLGFILYNVQGSVVYRSPIAPRSGVWTETIPSASLPKGNYVLNILLGDKTITEKIIRQ